jgi:hypothetical protein
MEDKKVKVIEIEKKVLKSFNGKLWQTIMKS